MKVSKISVTTVRVKKGVEFIDLFKLELPFSDHLIDWIRKYSFEVTSLRKDTLEISHYEGDEHHQYLDSLFKGDQ